MFDKFLPTRKSPKLLPSWPWIYGSERDTKCIVQRVGFSFRDLEAEESDDDWMKMFIRTEYIFGYYTQRNHQKSLALSRVGDPIYAFEACFQIDLWCDIFLWENAVTCRLNILYDHLLEGFGCYCFELAFGLIWFCDISKEFTQLMPKTNTKRLRSVTNV